MSFAEDLSKFLANFGFKVKLKQPWEALKLLEKVQPAEDIKGQIETGVLWDVPIVLGKNSVIKAPSRIEGPVIIGEDTIVGPFAYLRGPVIIGSNCKIGTTEVKNSVIMDGTWASHLAFIGDSIVGRKCNFGAGTKLANFRLDGDLIKITVEKESYKTGLRKLGSVIEDGVSIGCNSVLNPGTYVKKNAKVMPGSVVSGYIE